MTTASPQQYSSILDNPVFTPALKQQIDQVQTYQTLTESFVSKVIRGVHKNAILQGPPGLGKSHVVQTALINAKKTEGKDFVIVKGHITPLQLFGTLYMFRRPGQVVVLDDCDDIMANEIGISIIKAASDPDNRRVTYSTTRSPIIAGTVVKDFVFNGTLIICSNVAMDTGNAGRRNQHMRAILSRTTNWPMGWDTKEQKFAQVYNMVVNHDYLSATLRTRITEPQKEELLAYLLDNLDEIRNLDLRLPQKVAAEMVEGGDWRKSCAPFLKA
jgi:Cdc6-like AAA superfamily ATPase